MDKAGRPEAGVHRLVRRTDGHEGNGSGEGARTSPVIRGPNTRKTVAAARRQAD
jgi:hypothetical protein